VGECHDLRPQGPAQSDGPDGVTRPLTHEWPWLGRYHPHREGGDVMATTPQAPVSWESPERVEGPAPGVEFAPHGGRLVAYIIDTILISVILIVALLVAAPLLANGSTTTESGRVTSLGATAPLGFLLVLIGFLVAFLYFPFFWARGGQTPG